MNHLIILVVYSDLDFPPPFSTKCLFNVYYRETRLSLSLDLPTWIVRAELQRSKTEPAESHSRSPSTSGIAILPVLLNSTEYGA